MYVIKLYMYVCSWVICVCICILYSYASFLYCTNYTILYISCYTYSCNLFTGIRYMHDGFSHMLTWLLSMHPPQRMAPNERIHSHLGLVQLGWLHSRSARVQSSFHSQCIPLLPLDPATMTRADSSHLCVYSELTTTFKIIHGRVPGGLEHFSYEVCWWPIQMLYSLPQTFSECCCSWFDAGGFRHLQRLHQFLLFVSCWRGKSYFSGMMPLFCWIESWLNWLNLVCWSCSFSNQSF